MKANRIQAPHGVKQTWGAVMEGWRLVANKLRATGEHDQADRIRNFLSSMPQPMTEKERLLRGQRGGGRRPPRDMRSGADLA